MCSGTILIQTDFTENLVKSSLSVYWDTVIQSALCHVYVQTNSKETGSVERNAETCVIVSNYLHHQSDGSASHFKQKFTFCSLTLQSLQANQNSSATSYGKGCIDEIGGTVKLAEKINSVQMLMFFMLTKTKLRCKNQNWMISENPMVIISKLLKLILSDMLCILQ